MRYKLTKISAKSFVLMFSIINVIAGFLLGIMVTIASLIAPEQQPGGEIGAWAIIIFPMINGLLGVLTGFMLTGVYNLLVRLVGGIEFELEQVS